VEQMERIMNPPMSPGKLFAKTIAALAIAVFWCVSAVGTTVGVTTLATAVAVATSTPAEAYRRGRGRRGVRRGVRDGVGGIVATAAILPTVVAGMALPTTVAVGTVRVSAFGSKAPVAPDD
jgi:hypothetical protein